MGSDQWTQYHFLGRKVSFDVWYVDHQSIGLDLRIFLLTIWKVIRREGISAAGEAATAPYGSAERMSDLLILGAGGHAKVVAETAIARGVASSVAFLDDRCTRLDGCLPVLGWPVIGPLALALQADTRSHFDAAVVAIGHAATRLHWIKELQAAGFDLPVLMHPTAWVSPSAEFGPASVVFAQAAVQAQTSIGMGAILNTGCSVDHDAQLADGVHICPGARLAGEVKIGARSWIGIGASVIQQLHIGSDVIVGAGAAVIRDLPSSVTAVGVPARVVSPN